MTDELLATAMGLKSQIDNAERIAGEIGSVIAAMDGTLVPLCTIHVNISGLSEMYLTNIPVSEMKSRFIYQKGVVEAQVTALRAALAAL